MRIVYHTDGYVYYVFDSEYDADVWENDNGIRYPRFCFSGFCNALRIGPYEGLTLA